MHNSSSYYKNLDSDKYLQKQARVIRNSDLFDEIYYKKQINLDWNAHDPVLHFLTTGAENFINPSAEFNVSAYFASFPELIDTSTNPLYHCLLSPERKEVWKDSTRNNYLAIYKESADFNRPFFIKHNRVAIFSSCFIGNAKVEEGCIYFLEELTQCVDVIIAAFAGPLPACEFAKIKHLLNYCIFLDTNSSPALLWKKGIDLAQASQLLTVMTEVVLCDASLLGPICPFEYLLDRQLQTDFLATADIINLSAQIGCESSMFLPFFVIRERLLKSGAIFDLSRFLDITNFSQSITHLSREGYDVKVLQSDMFILNPKYKIPVKQKETNEVYVFIKKLFDSRKELIARKNPALSNLIITNFDINNFPTGISIVLQVDGRINALFNVIDSIIDTSFDQYELLIIDPGYHRTLILDIEYRYGNELKLGRIKYFRASAEERYFDLIKRSVNLAKFNWILHLTCDFILTKNSLTQISTLVSGKTEFIFHFCPDDTAALFKPFENESQSRHMRIDGLLHRKNAFYDNLADIPSHRINNSVANGINVKKRKYFSSHGFISANTNGPIRSSAKAFRDIVNIQNQSDAIVTTIIKVSRNTDRFVNAIVGAIKQRGDFRHDLIVLTENPEHIGQIRKIHKFNDRFSSINLEIRVLASNTLREAIQTSRGQYICFITGEDYWYSSDKLAMQIEFLRQNRDCLACSSGFLYFYRQSGECTIGKKQTSLKQKFDIGDFIRHNNPLETVSGIMFTTAPLKYMPLWTLDAGLSIWTLLAWFQHYGNFGFIPHLHWVHPYGKDIVLDDRQAIYSEMLEIKAMRLACEIVPETWGTQLRNYVLTKENSLYDLMITHGLFPII